MKRSGVIAAVAGLAMAMSAAAMLQPERTNPRQPAKDAAGQPERKMPTPEEMQQAWDESMKITEHHERLAQLAGTWKADCKFWMPGAPTTEPQTSTGTMVNTMIYGGRFLKHEFTGEFDGKPFAGSGVWGYNNLTKKYESTWCDSMGTGIMVSTDGTYDAATKTYSSTSEHVTPFGKVKNRDIVRVVNANTHVMEMYQTMAGAPEMKVMEITYTRTTPTTEPGTRAIDPTKPQAK